MESKRNSITWGILLVLAGILIFAYQFIPELNIWASAYFGWPMIIIAVAVILLVTGLVTGKADSVVSSCVIGGIGAILLYQNNTGDWGSWAYMWALLPGFGGAGQFLSTIVTREPKDMLQGLKAIAFSGILFLIFSNFFGGFNPLGKYWPVLIIAVGFFMIIEVFVKNKKE
jgi:hypothetical protein